MSAAMRSANVDMTFTCDASAQPFAVSLQTYLSTNPWTKQENISAIATGALVLSTTTDDHFPRVLLVRRAASDSMPGLWEVPGGAVDNTDVSILAGVARELQEESGLRATHIGPVVGEPQVFVTTRRGLRVAKFYFICAVDDERKVVLDPAEHSEYVWASRDECEAGRVVRRRSLEWENDGRDVAIPLPFTATEQRDVILDAFRVFEAQSRSTT